MNVNLMNPMKKVMLPVFALMLTAGAATSCNRDYEAEFSIPQTIPDIPKPFDPMGLHGIDSTTLARLDSLLAVTKYKVDSVNNASGDRNALDSIANDAQNKWNEILGNN